MKNLLKLSLFVIVSLTFTQCKTSTGSSSSSSLTGWKFNDPKYGNFSKGKYSKSFDKPPMGMVAVEGGSFTMGQVQDDVMFDWNRAPKKKQVRSFYMDEAEVTNSEYSLFLQYTKKVFPPEDLKYKHIYPSILPDTSVWKKSYRELELLSENYLRHPAYSDYPVVGVSWLQATQYCKWRTNAVNLKILMDRGVIKSIFTRDSLEFNGLIYKKYRLPTEAEWEYAATIGKGRKKYKKGEWANFKQSKGNYSGPPHQSIDGAYIPIKIRSYYPNSLGLYDMYGNVAEWVVEDGGDRNSSRYYKPDSMQFSTSPAMTIEKDGITDNITVKYDEQSKTTLISNRNRVYKGGSWKDRKYWLNPAHRRYLPEYMSTNYIGFRCVTDKNVRSKNYSRKRRNSKR